MSIQDRKLGFYSLRLVSNADLETPLPSSTLKAVIEYIRRLRAKDRLVDVARSHKFHLLAQVRTEGKVQSVIFKSGKYHHRPPLLDKNTTAERDSPKTLTEGESEKTHILLRYLRDEIGIIIEERRNGIAIRTVIRYLRAYAQKLEQSGGPRLDYQFETETLAKEDFLEELKALASVKIGEVHLAKKLLGDEFFDLTERTENVKEDLVLKLEAQRGRSIFGPLQDIFKRFKRKDSPITKIRAVGFGERGQKVVLDTDLIRKIEYIEAEIDASTGVVDTTSFFEAVRPFLAVFE